MMKSQILHASSQTVPAHSPPGGAGGIPLPGFEIGDGGAAAGLARSAEEARRA